MNLDLRYLWFFLNTISLAVAAVTIFCPLLLAYTYRPKLDCWEKARCVSPR